MMKTGLRNAVLGAILCGLAISGPAAAGEKGSEEDHRLLETRLLNEGLRKELQLLKQENGSLRKELETLRRLYADLIVKVNRRIDEMQETELQAAHLVDRRDVGDSLRELARTLVFLRSGILEMERELKASEQSWKAVLDVLRPSEALRHEVESRIVSLRRVFESSLKPLSIVARRDGGDPDKTGCRVAEIDLPRQILLIDKGSLQGLVPGMRLKASLPGGASAVVRVVECRPSVSCAVPETGSILDLSAGMALEPVRSGE